MKSQKGFNLPDTDDVIRKPAKLEPIRKSGKESHNLYNRFDDDIDEEKEYEYRKKESVLDYFDDGEDEEDEEDEEEEDDEEDDEDDDEEDDEEEEE